MFSNEACFAMIQVLKNPGETTTFNTNSGNGEEEENQISFDTAVECIPEIAEMLGPTRTANELIPFVFPFSTYYEDEIISTLNACERIDLESFTQKDLINFFLNYSTVFTRDSFRVRKEAMNVFISLSQKIIHFDIFGTIFSGLVRNNNVNIRRAACQIMSEFATIVTPKVFSKLFQTVIPLSDDKNAIVKREFAHCLASSIGFIEDVDSDELKIFEIIQKLTNTKLVTVLLEIPRILVGFIESSKKVDTAEIIKICSTIMQSNNWKVVVSLLKNMHNIMITEDCFDKYLSFVAQSVQSNDVDISIAGIDEIPFYVKISGEKANFNAVKQMLDSVYQNSKNQTVLTNFAKITPLLFKVDKLKQYTTDLIQKLVLKNNPVVTSNLVSSLVAHEKDDSFDLILQVLDQGTSFNDWRDRETVVECIYAVVASILQSHKELLDKIMPILAKYLIDDAIAIRSNTVMQLEKLKHIFDDDEILKKFMKILNETFDQTSDYQIKQTIVIAINKLELLDRSEIAKSIIEKAIKDKISNVRYTCALYLPENSHFLELLENDVDEDVRDEAAKRSTSPSF